MAGLKGKSGPPGNMTVFKHGLASIQKRREEGVPTEYEESVRQQILDGLIADKGGDEQISTATRILDEVIAGDAAWLMIFNGLAHLTAEGQQFVPLRQVLSQKIRPRFGQPKLLDHKKTFRSTV